MPSRSIGITLVTAGLVAALSGPGFGPDEALKADAVAPADTTLPGEWIAQVTMEPIRVVMTREARLEAVTMETIRVTIPRQDGATPDSESTTPRR